MHSSESVLALFIWFEGATGISRADGPTRRIFGDDTARSNHGTFAKGNSHLDDSPGRNPGMLLHHDGLSDQRELPLGVIMRSSTQIGSLGDGHKITQLYRRGIVNFSPVRDRDHFARLQVPGRPNH